MASKYIKDPDARSLPVSCFDTAIPDEPSGVKLTAKGRLPPEPRIPRISRKRPRRPEDLLADEMLLLLYKMGVFAKRHVVDNRPRAGGAHIRAGLGLGVSDIVAVVPPYGRALFAELKLPGYSPSKVRPDQTRFLTTARLHCAVTGIVTCAEEMIQLVQIARCLP